MAASCFWLNNAQHPGGITRHDGVGGNISRDYAAGAHNRVFADAQVGENGGAGTDGSARADQRLLHLPVFFGLQVSVGIRRAWIRIVGECHAVADEYIVFNYHTFANKGVARNFAPLADTGILLDFDKRPYLCLISDFAAVKVDELR